MPCGLPLFVGLPRRRGLTTKTLPSLVRNSLFKFIRYIFEYRSHPLCHPMSTHVMNETRPSPFFAVLHFLHSLFLYITPRIKNGGGLGTRLSVGVVQVRPNTHSTVKGQRSPHLCILLTLKRNSSVKDQGGVTPIYVHFFILPFLFVLFFGLPSLHLLMIFLVYRWQELMSAAKRREGASNCHTCNSYIMSTSDMHPE